MLKNKTSAFFFGKIEKAANVPYLKTDQEIPIQLKGCI
jgi:hypothetical protein